MRLPPPGPNEFSSQIAKIIENVQKCYFLALEGPLNMIKADTMLADGTTVQVDTFDPHRIDLVFSALIKALNDDGWTSSGISSSSTDDLRRLFFQISKNVSYRFVLIANFSLQYHVLLYYKSSRRITEIQSELSKVENEAAKVFVSFSSEADLAIARELKADGLETLDTEELLSAMFENDTLNDRLTRRAKEIESTHPELERLKVKRDKLISELHDYVLEIYQTKPDLIDSNRLMAGEDGLVSYFDIEPIKRTYLKKSAARSSLKPGEAVDATKLTIQEMRKIREAIAKVAEALTNLR